MVHDCAESRIGGIDEIAKPPTTFEPGVGEDRAVDVDDVFGKLEEPEGCFASVFIRHDKNDTARRIQTALTRHRIVITELIRRGKGSLPRRADNTLSSISTLPSFRSQGHER